MGTRDEAQKMGEDSLKVYENYSSSMWTRSFGMYQAVTSQLSDKAGVNHKYLLALIEAFNPLHA